MKKIYLLLTLSGVLFSGYLSSVKFFTKTCAFNESCPYFLGQPACYYGFIIFLGMFIITIYSIRNKFGEIWLSKKLSMLSLSGIIFSGYLVVIVENFRFSTCTLGLGFYTIIFILSVWYLNKFKIQKLS